MDVKEELFAIRFAHDDWAERIEDPIGYPIWEAALLPREEAGKVAAKGRNGYRGEIVPASVIAREVRQRLEHSRAQTGRLEAAARRMADW